MRLVLNRIACGTVRRALLALGLAAAVVSTARGQLVQLNETFTGTTMSSDWAIGVGKGSFTPSLTAATGIDSSGSGWLRLTDTATQEATSVRDTRAFTSANASIAVKFNYAAYGGTGADGITFFLADASVPFATGAYGGSLGYANMNAGPGYVNAGMAGGYIGLGLDEYGNFASSSEGKHGGLGTGLYANSVSVRGPGSNQNGYDYLGGTQPFSPPFAFPSDSTRPTGSEARTFEIIITASNQLTVYMQAGDTAALLPLYSIDLSGYARPDQLILGFTASSGGSTDIHEVQGLQLASQVANLWKNSSGNSSWNTGANWTGNGTIPQLGADVLLDNQYVTTSQTIALGNTTQSIRSLQIDAPFSYNVGSTAGDGTIHLNSQGIIGPVGIFVSQGHGAAAHTINSNLVADESLDVKNYSSGSLTIAGNFALGNNTVTFGGGGSGGTTIAGVVSGTGNVVKNDSGTLALNGNNTYSGGTTLNGGTISVGHNNGLGTSALTINSGTLSSSASNTVSNILALQGSATFSNITTAGTLTQTGGSYTLNMANATQSGAVLLSNSNVGQTLTVQVDSGTSTISGAISNGGTGAGSLTKTGAGTLRLSGTDTYTGPTTISAGTLQLGASNVLLNTGTLAIGSSGTFDLNGFSQKIGTLQAAGGAAINFGSGSTNNTFVFGNYTAPTSGVLTISNYNYNSGNISAGDIFGTTTNGLDVSSIYINGVGTAQLGGVTNTVYGNAYVITAQSLNWIWWTGNNTGNVAWSTASNWSGTVPNGNTALAALGSGSQNPDLGGNRTVNGLLFAGNAARSYNITGNTSTLTMNSGTANGIAFIQQMSALDQTMSFNTLALAKSTVVDIGGAGNLTISSIISGTGNLNKEGTGAGRLILSGANTFTGNVVIDNGILQANNANALGNNTVGTVIINNGGELDLSNTGTVAKSTITATGGGADGVSGAIVNLAGTNTLSGSITESAGNNTIFGAKAGSLTISGNITGTNTNTVFTGNGSITANYIGTGTGAVSVSGNTALSVTYAGGNANTYTGTTTVGPGTLTLNKTVTNGAIIGDVVINNGGTVKLGAAEQIADTSGLTINSGGKFDLGGKSETIGNFSGSGTIDNTVVANVTLTFGDTSVNTFSGTITDTAGSLALTKLGSGKLTLTNTNTYSGNTTISAGILSAQANSALGTGNVIVSSGAKLSVSNGTTLNNAMTLNGNGTLANDGAIESLAGNNVISGPLALNSATLIQSDAGSLLTLGGAITSGNIGLTLGGTGAITVTGSIGIGTGTLTKTDSGYVILNPNGNSTFTGAAYINGGTLEIQKSTALGTSAGGVSVASGGTLALSGNITTAESPITIAGSGDNNTGALRNISGANTLSGAVTLGAPTTIGSEAGTLTLSGVVTAAAGNDLTKIGNGTLTFGGGSANAIGGNVTVAAGTLVLNQTVAGALGNGIVTIGDGSGTAATLQLGSSAAANQIGTGATVALNTAGKLDVNGRTQTIGSLTDGTTTGGTVTLGGGTLTVGNGGNGTFTGSVSGAGTLIKTGTGTLVLGGTAGSNAIAPGTLQLNQGTVQLAASNILGTAVTMNGGTLSLNGNSETLNSLTVQSSSSIDFNNAAAVLNLTNGTYTGGTLTINNWSGSLTGGGSDQLLLTGTITGSLLSNITFAGYGAGAQMIGTEIVPLTGGVYVWKVNSDGNWTTGTNWTNGSAPNGVGVSVVFGNAILADHTVTLNGNVTAGYLTFNDDNNYTIGNSTNKLTLAVSAGNAQINVSNTGANTINSAIGLSNALVIAQNSTGTLTLSNSITGTNQNITVGGSGNTNVGGVIATGTGSMTKNGTGNLTLSGNNTYSGGTTINGGTVSIGSDANLGATTGSLTLNGGTLQNGNVVALSSTRAVTIGANGGTFQADANISYSGALAGNGTLTKTGTQTLTLAGSTLNSHTGNVSVAAGTLELAKTGAVSALGDSASVSVASGAVLKFNGNASYTGETIGSLSGAGTVNNAAANAFTLTTGGNNGNTTFSGTIQNTGGALGLTKVGTGTMTLTGNNSYTGATNVNAGVLNIQNSNALGAASGGTTVLANAALEMQGDINIGAQALTLAGTGVASNGALRNVSGNNTAGGTIALTGATTIKSEAGSLTLGGNITGTQNLTLDGAGAITINGAITTGTATVTKNGSGYVVLAGNSNYTGATTISSGTLEIRSATALGTTAGATTVNSGATLAFGGNGSFTTGELLTLNGTGDGNTGALHNLSGSNTLNGTINLATSSTFAVDSGSTLTGNAVISGTGSLSKIGGGTLVLKAVNTFTGDVNITEGTVSVGTDTALGNTTTSAIVINGGTLATTATMTLASTRGVSVGPSGGTVDTAAGTTLTYAGVVSGTSGGALTKTGAGSLTLSGTNTYNGPTNVNGGQLNITADANLGASGQAINLNGGTLALAGTGNVTSTRAITLNGGNSTLTINSGNLINSGGITANGTANTINVNAGSLISNGAITLNASCSETINIAAGAGVTIGGGLTGTGNLTVVGASTTSSLTFNSTINFNGSLTLSGGTVYLGGNNVNLSSLTITGNTILDFGNSAASTLNVGTLNILGNATLVTVNNWVNASDYFYAGNFTGPTGNSAVLDQRGGSPENQVSFTGFSNNNTTWASWDHEITPTPEPATYGVLFLSACVGVFGWRRWRTRNRS